MKALFELVNSIYPISAEIGEFLIQNLQRKLVKRKQFLLKEGQTCKNIYFIEEGLVRCFYIKGSKEVCSWFMKEGDMVISVESFFKQKPSYESIQVLEDSVLYTLHHDQLQLLYHRFPEFNFVGRKITENYYALCEQRLYSLRMQKAFERYEYLITHHPELVQRVPSTYLASYLGIALETLSRMKHRMIL